MLADKVCVLTLKFETKEKLQMLIPERGCMTQHGWVLKPQKTQEKDYFFLNLHFQDVFLSLFVSSEHKEKSSQVAISDEV